LQEIRYTRGRGRGQKKTKIELEEKEHNLNSKITECSKLLQRINGVLITKGKAVQYWNGVRPGEDGLG